MAAVRRVAVVGAGLAGLACALGAAAAGCEVQVLESRSSLQVPPAHVDVVPNLLRDLDRLGVLPTHTSPGFAYPRVVLADAQGRLLDTLPLPRLAGERRPPACGMLRADLLDALTQAAQARGTQLHLGCTVQAVLSGPAQAQLQFTRSDAPHAEPLALQADLVLLATGAGGALRQALFADAPVAQALPQQWWHAVLPRPTELDAPTWLLGAGTRRLYVVPIGPTQAGVALLQPAADDTPADQRAAAFRRALQGFAGLPAAVAAALHEGAPIPVRAVREALLPRPWLRGRVLAVGDCAHTLVPHFGQSAAQAVEDAVVLRELLAAALPLAELGAAFEQRRHARAARVQALTSRAAHWNLRPEASTDLLALSAELDALVRQPA